VCKPAAAAALLATAVVLDPTFGDTRAWFCVALAWCVAGDVFLMLPRDAFVAGLAAFLVAQVCFAVGFALHPSSTLAVVVGIAVVVALAVPLAARFVVALRSSGRGGLVGPVLAYVGAIGAMVACAIGSGVAVGVAGAAFFFVSDSLIAETRFVGPRPWGPVTVMVTYHLALTGLVVSLTV
jgi:uncharacterized membrane protein YhhN